MMYGLISHLLITRFAFYRGRGKIAGRVFNSKLPPAKPTSNGCLSCGDRFLSARIRHRSCVRGAGFALILLHSEKLKQHCALIPRASGPSDFWRTDFRAMANSEGSSFETSRNFLTATKQCVLLCLKSTQCRYLLCLSWIHASFKSCDSNSLPFIRKFATPTTVPLCRREKLCGIAVSSSWFPFWFLILVEKVLNFKIHL